MLGRREATVIVSINKPSLEDALITSPGLGGLAIVYDAMFINSLFVKSLQAFPSMGRQRLTVSVRTGQGKFFSTVAGYSRLGL